MPCCGKGRQSMRAPNVPRAVEVSPRGQETPVTGPLTSLAYFRYVGPTGIQVRAPISGNLYRFAQPGAVVAVDPRDRRALAGVPHLIQVAAPD